MTEILIGFGALVGSLVVDFVLMLKKIKQL